ncbi:hypothetical protein HOP50_04g35240 [Chloropicon primus]|uniref:Glycine cleavage system H protein n=1 Tax=Chloropicon primus TaxID=1764295 RepID=A0A5B8MKS9_9CHLO|nr:hypothetical protein A3770_04p35170 [Chloropicon primus]UPR00210.1 hypothetical protein HOP50_04g35240 [Chloropicon primus]|eukprot:QDZ20999.1 hypothetical protein A3770_04p35170 [Chloropicon primus]
MRSKVFTRAQEVLRRVGTRGGEERRVVFTMGVTERGLEDIGEVKAVTFPGKGAEREKGEVVAEVHWEGVVDSSADEMYHSLFRYEGNGLRKLRAPFACTVLELNSKLAANPNGPEILDAEREEGGGWIVQLEARERDLEGALKEGDVLSEEAYEEAKEAEDQLGRQGDAGRLQY